MTRRRIYYLVITGIVFMVSLGLLISGSSLLNLLLLKDPPFPLGTLSTWAGLIALPCIIFFSIKVFHPPRSNYAGTYKLGLKIIILLNISWGLLSYILAGNWTFNFSNASPGFQGSIQASLIFIRYTYFLVFLSFAYLLVYSLHTYLRKFKKL